MLQWHVMEKTDVFNINNWWDEYIIIDNNSNNL